MCVAEGAGQDILDESSNGGGATDASGNPILKDIGWVPPGAQSNRPRGAGWKGPHGMAAAGRGGIMR